MDATLKTAALAALETVIARALQYDPGTRFALGRLHGQVLAVQLTQPKLLMYVHPEPDRLRLSGYYEGEVTTHLRGSLPAMIKLATANSSSFAGSGVEVFGNTGLLVELQGLLKQLDIDWEAAISQFAGDIAGPQIARGIRQILGYSIRQGKSASRLGAEYLTEELQILPSRRELELFYDDVDQLRLYTDRLEARLQRLMESAAP